jgi:hypothetical protein
MGSFKSSWDTGLRQAKGGATAVRLMLAVAGVAGTIMVAALAVRGVSEPPAGPAAVNGMRLRGVHSTLARDGRVEAKVSADSVEIGHARAFGPFRFGFLRGVIARNITVETFEKAGGEAGPDTHALLGGTLSSLAPGLQHGKLAQAEARRVRLIRHRENGGTVSLEALECHTTTLQAAIVCRDGMIRDGHITLPFAEASYGAQGLAITPAHQE